jgi:PAS domain-containing protein
MAIQRNEKRTTFREGKEQLNDLGRAESERSSHLLSRSHAAILEAIPANVARLDDNGKILAVNYGCPQDACPASTPTATASR